MSSNDDDEFPYVLLDRASTNFLAEWRTYEEAEAGYLERIGAGQVAADLELWHEDKRIHVAPSSDPGDCDHHYGAC